MQPRITMVSLGISDFKRSLEFYQDLGWNAQVMEDIAFFQLDNIIFSIYPKEKLAEDATVSAEGSGFRGVAVAYNVGSEKEVDETLAFAVSKGATLVKKGQKVFWGGYSGYFSDPDGHLWEVAFNPFWEMDENGMVKLPVKKQNVRKD